MTFKKSLLCAAAMALGIESSSFAVTLIHVDGTGGSATPANHGDDWGSAAYLYLSDAITYAATLAPFGDVEIRVRGATSTGITYKPTSGSDRSASFNLIAGVKIFGGYIGSGPNPDTRDPSTYVTVLSGNINNTGIATDNSYHVVACSDSAATNSNCSLDGFTITMGYAENGASPPDPDPASVGGEGGGGMWNVHDASPRVANCIFVSNHGLLGGGMWNLYGSNPIVVNCTFHNNDADNGGGMFNYFRGNPIVVNCRFLANHADHAGGGVDTKDGNTEALSGDPTTSYVKCIEAIQILQQQ